LNIRLLEKRTTNQISNSKKLAGCHNQWTTGKDKPSQ